MLIGAFIAALLALLTAHGLQATFGYSVGSFFAVLIFAWFAFIVAIVTPYQIWKEDRARLADLEDPKRARLDFGDIFVTTDPPHASGRAHRHVYVKVHNVDSRKRELRNCLATIVDYTDSLGRSTPFPDKSLRTMYQRPDQSGPFNLRADQPKRILIASLDETKEGSKIKLGYADPDRFCPDVDATHKLRMTVAIYADEGERISRDYELYVDGYGTLVLKTVA